LVGTALHFLIGKYTGRDYVLAVLLAELEVLAGMGLWGVYGGKTHGVAQRFVPPN